MATEIVSVVVVDDHQFVVDGMRRRARGRLSVVAWAKSAAGGAALAQTRRPDVVAMDLHGVGSVWPSVRQITQDLEIPVLIVTGGGLLEHADRALESGASGIARKGSNSDETIAALQAVAAGGEFWTDPWAARVEQLRSGQIEPAPILSAEELRLARSIALGWTQAEIAEWLGVRRQAASEAIGELRRRVGVDNDAALVARLFANGWIEGESLL